MTSGGGGGVTIVISRQPVFDQLQTKEEHQQESKMNHMNRLVASQLRSLAQVAQQVVVPPASGRFSPIADLAQQVYICFESRRLFWRPSRPIAETYNLRLTGEGLLITVFRAGRPVPPTHLVPYAAIEQIKFYYGDSRIRIRFSCGTTAGCSHHLQHFTTNFNNRNLHLPVQNPLRPRLLYLNFVMESERVRLLTTLVSARMIDFSRSPAPRVGGFAVVFLPRLVSLVRPGGAAGGGVAISDRVNLLEDALDAEEEEEVGSDEDEEVLNADDDHEDEDKWSLLGQPVVPADD